MGRPRSVHCRYQADTEWIYAQSIKADGILKGARNESVAVPSSFVTMTSLLGAPGSGPAQPLKVETHYIGGAHLMEGAIRAEKVDVNKILAQMVGVLRGPFT